MKEKKKEKTHGVQLLLRAVVTDPDGKVISDTGEKPANSFVIQFLQFIKAMFDGGLPTGGVNQKDTSGVSRRIYVWSYSPNVNFRIDAPVNNSLYGVVVGTGDAAESNTDYKLQTQLTEGIGAGNITHASVTFVTTAVVGPNVDLLIKRAFTNNTVSAIIVKETGIYTRHTQTGPYYHCIVRVLFPGPVNVPAKCSLAIYYTMRTTV